MAIEIVKPNLTAIQTAFTGRLYSMDMFTLYRAGVASTPPIPLSSLEDSVSLFSRTW